MRTQAQQLQIDQIRIDAEMYRKETEQRHQDQIQQLAQFVGASFQQQQQNQPHVIYTRMSGNPPPPAPPPPPQPNTSYFDNFARRMQQLREEDERKLHHEMAATQQSVRQIVDQKEGEVLKAQEMAKAAMATAAASTDEIRMGRKTKQWNDELTAELRGAKEANVAQQQQIANMQRDAFQFFEQQRDNAVTKAQREKERLDAATASSSTKRPPPPPGGTREKVANTTSKPLFVRNPIQLVPSLQPTGVQVPGAFGAVMPNTGLSIPANLAPPTNNTRIDSKPDPKSMREGADPAVRQKAQQQTQANDKKKQENKEDTEESKPRKLKTQKLLWAKDRTISRLHHLQNRMLRHRHRSLNQLA